MQRHWNIRVPPQTDELLTSWLHRMAIANGYVDHSFCREMFDRKPIWTRDADRHFPLDQLPTLERWTGVPVAQLESMMLGTAVTKMSEADQRSGIAPWVLPLGVYHRVRRAFGVQFCPACLREEPAYVRIGWRLAWVTSCSRHRCELHDQCPDCGAPFMFHRTRPWLFGAIPCARCGFDLSMAEVVRVNDATLQVALEEGLAKGWVWLAREPVYSVAAFTGLRELARALTARRTESLRLQLGMDCVFPRRTQLERLCVGDRRLVMRALSALLQRWPDNLLEGLAASGMHPSFLWHVVNPTVHWLRSALSPIRPVPSSDICEEQIAWACAQLKEQGQEVRAAAVKRLLGAPMLLLPGTSLRRACARSS